MSRKPLDRNQKSYQGQNLPPSQRSVPDENMSRSTDDQDEQKFETSRIQVLQQERVHVQKKTFTKWCNSHLEKVTAV